jgi:hypothetical protein
MALDAVSVRVALPTPHIFVVDVVTLALPKHIAAKVF